MNTKLVINTDTTNQSVNGEDIQEMKKEIERLLKTSEWNRVKDTLINLKTEFLLKTVHVSVEYSVVNNCGRTHYHIICTANDKTIEHRTLSELQSELIDKILKYFYILA